jgi:hypothetical protein
MRSKPACLCSLAKLSRCVGSLPWRYRRHFDTPAGQHRAVERTAALPALGSGGPAGAADREQAGPAVALADRVLQEPGALQGTGAVDSFADAWAVATFV